MYKLTDGETYRHPHRNTLHRSRIRSNNTEKLRRSLLMCVQLSHTVIAGHKFPKMWIYSQCSVQTYIVYSAGKYKKYRNE